MQLSTSVKSQPWSSSSIILPAELWKGRSFEEIFPPRKFKNLDGPIYEQPHAWELLPSRKVQMKNMPEMEILEIANKMIHIPSRSAEDRAKVGLQALQEAGRYRPTTK